LAICNSPPGWCDLRFGTSRSLFVDFGVTPHPSFGHPLPKGEGCFDKNEETAEDPAATYLPICPSANLPASRLDQAFLHREQHQFRRAVEVEGFHDAGAVHGDRIDADIKQCSNFLIGFSLGY